MTKAKTKRLVKQLQPMIGLHEYMEECALTSCDESSKMSYKKSVKSLRVIIEFLYTLPQEI